MNFDDLNIQKEIIPLFDTFLNRRSREALESIFADMPATLEDVLYRQQIISAIISNRKRIRSIASIRSDIEDAYRFCKAIGETHQELFSDNINAIIVRLLFNSPSRARLISGAIQLGHVLKTMDERYFTTLKVDFFPQAYGLEMSGALGFLNSLRSFYSVEGFTTGNLPRRKYLLFLKQVAMHVTEMELFWKFFFRFDAYVSIAGTMESKGFCVPVFQDWGIAIDDVFHPFLEKPVRNSISSKAGIILLTGANMSGKSTFLKAISMCVYLGHLGIGVPASKCVMPYFKDIVVNIYSKDNLQSGLSHFMSEVKALKSAVLSAEKGQHVFAVMDELFAGTNTQDAEALLQLTIEGLKKYSKGLFIISTHYSQLKEFVASRPHLSASYYLDATLENGFPRFNYQLKEGWSNHKFGMLLFEKEGLKKLFEL
ncbi:MutS-related protein [Pinibacter aurantiacus]|uniref:DNA mismatch repair proteins mutS family domain-containing protein n=1 Tax=Pinibacter aurantiacus TaxID=2851599 RepID=A0A9E2W451_9BACT|nr:hypothetical protein [Pinibacter aurantiacus]MBV4357514.1 hypothetical protein [Pinibacter aurantiacus]